MMTKKIKQKLVALNKKIKNCKKCRLHKTRKNSIVGEGDIKARIMLIAQAPGETEDEQDKMFVGQAGDILDDLLDYSNIDKSNFYITNLLKCMLPNCRKPKQDEIKACASYLLEEIKLVYPKFLVPLGFYATNFLFDKFFYPRIAKKEFPDYIGKLLYADGFKIYPLTHPSAIFYDEKIRQPAYEYYRKLKIFSHNCKWYDVCPMKYFTDKGMLDKKWTELYCKGDWESCSRFKMEEKSEYHPPNMLPNGEIDESLT